MTRIDQLKYCGSLQQLAYLRNVTVHEGRANGLRVVEAKNDNLRFQVMVDKCLDISYLEYRGINLSFTSKPGLNGRNQYDTHGQEALRSIMGGLFFTAGLQNICSPCESGGEEYPMHGRIRTTPSEHLCSDAFWDGDNYVLEISGEMREAELFGANLVLRRRLRSVYGSGKIEIIDEVENQTAEAAPLMLMYHCNFGYPFIQPGTRLILPSRSVSGREEWSSLHMDHCKTVTEPIDGETEYVFLHELAEFEDGSSFAAIVNDSLGFGVRLDFDHRVQPYFMEWMSMRSGDYVIGLEPSNSSVYGRPYHEKRGDLHTLPAFSKEKFRLSFTILRDMQEIKNVEHDAEVLLKNKKE